MPRYKTVAVAKCERGHNNFVEDISIVDSVAESQQLTINKSPAQRCKFCDSEQGLKFVQFIGTEKLSSSPMYDVFGYTCECGERVEVFRIERGMGQEIPLTLTVSCSKGHSLQMTGMQILSLPKWTEQAN